MCAYELGGEGGNVTDPDIPRVRNGLDPLPTAYYLLPTIIVPY